MSTHVKGHEHSWQFVEEIIRRGKIITKQRLVPNYAFQSYQPPRVETWREAERVKCARFICECGETKEVDIKK